MIESYRLFIQNLEQWFTTHGFSLQFILVLLLITLLLIIIFLLLREFQCWYWKINKIIDLLEDLKEKKWK